MVRHIIWLEAKNNPKKEPRFGTIHTALKRALINKDIHKSWISRALLGRPVRNSWCYKTNS